MAYYERTDKQVKLNQRVLTKYPDICKWKPQQLMTVDLLVQYDQNQKPVLLAGTYEGQQLRYPYSNVNKINKNLIIFQGSPRYLFTGNISWGIPSEEIPSKYPNNTVVEFSWDGLSESLQPHRLRLDKPKPNNVTFAIDNWNWAHGEITQNTLMGNDTILMRKYHNRIKRMLLTDNNNKKTLLDIGSGKGGDVSKWRQGGFSKIVAVEPNSQYITELRRRLKNENMGDNVRIIQTGGENSSLISNNVQEFIGDKVDVISCMLSLSFFWQSKDILQGLLDTIRMNLKDDGKVIFFTIDGDSVQQYFRPLFNHGLINQTIDTESLLLEPLMENNKITQLRIDVKDSQTATDQLEWLVRLADLSLGLYPINMKRLYFSKADKEPLLNPVETLLSRLYTYGVYNAADLNSLVQYKPIYNFSEGNLSESNFSEGNLSESNLSESNFPQITVTRSTSSLLQFTSPLLTDRPKENEDKAPEASEESVVSTNLYPLSDRFSPENVLPIIADDMVEKLRVPWTTLEVYRIGCIGDGSCFVHALLKSINKEYAQGNVDRVATAKYTRRDIAYLLSQGAAGVATLAPHTVYIYDQDKSVYDNYPQFAELAKFNPEYSLLELMKLINSTQYLSDEAFVIFADLFNINIYIMLANNRSLDYLSRFIRPQRQRNVVISGQGSHFELIGVKRGQLLQTMFTNNDQFIKDIEAKFIN